MGLPDTSLDPLAVLILGPTGSGKTALSLAVAKRFNGEIISCDSVSVYRGLDIGSAKPTVEERQQIPHYLIDVADPDQLDQSFTAGEYSRQAREAMRQITDRQRLPIVTGGTGLYLRALTQGLFDVPLRQPELRNRLLQSANRRSPNWLHRILTRLDPESSARIHQNDTPKLIRAIEICLTAKKPVSTAFQTGATKLNGFRLLRIGLNPPRQTLYDRLNQRAAAMFDSGLIEETRRLLNRYGRLPALDSLGYRQAAALIDGTMTREQAITAAQQGHRNYAKRQLTWFRREPEVHWIEAFGDEQPTFEQAAEFIARQQLPS